MEIRHVSPRLADEGTPNFTVEAASGRRLASTASPPASSTGMRSSPMIRSSSIPSPTNGPITLAAILNEYPSYYYFINTFSRVARDARFSPARKRTPEYIRQARICQPTASSRIGITCYPTVGGSGVHRDRSGRRSRSRLARGMMSTSSVTNAPSASRRVLRVCIFIPCASAITNFSNTPITLCRSR